MGPIIRAFLATILFLLCWSPPATAADSPVQVLQRKPFLRRERLEISPFAGLTINDALMRHFVVGGRANYHISEPLSVGVSVIRGLAQETDLYEKVQRDFALNPTVSRIDWIVTADASYALLYGKFVLFNSWLIHLDTSGSAGLGAAAAVGGHLGPAGFVGIGQRFVLARWLTVNLDLRHTVYTDVIRGDTELIHATIVSAGIGIFFPDFEYRTIR